MRFIYFDTETTGTRPEKDKIIELAAYDPLHGRSFEKLINPGMPIPPDAIAIHQITDEMVKDAPLFKTVAEEFISFCDGEIALVAHNSDSFDIPFLKAEFARHSVPWPSNWISIDSLKWARRYRKDLPRHSLQFLRQIYNIPPNQAHRALNDVMVLYQIFQYMIDDLTCEQVKDLLQRAQSQEIQSPSASLQTEIGTAVEKKNDTLLLFS